MKQTLFLSILSFFIFFNCAYAQSDSTHGVAKVFIIRETGSNGAWVNFRAIINDSVICKIANNRYSIHNIKPGQYTFYVSDWANSKKAKQGLEMQLEAGKTYYLRMAMVNRYMKQELLSFQDITYNSAAPLIAKCKEEADCEK